MKIYLQKIFTGKLQNVNSVMNAIPCVKQSLWNNNFNPTGILCFHNLVCQTSCNSVLLKQ